MLLPLTKRGTRVTLVPKSSARHSEENFHKISVSTRFPAFGNKHSYEFQTFTARRSGALLARVSANLETFGPFVCSMSPGRVEVKK
jgi:hypothetical protein